MKTRNYQKNIKNKIMEKEQGYKSILDAKVFKKIENLDLKWFPYIGKKYSEAPNKILIVGLSVYQKEPNENWDNILKTSYPLLALVDECGLQTHGYCGRYWKNLPKYFFKNENLSENNKKKLWEAVAFTEFLDYPMKGSKHIDNKKIRDEYFKKLSELIDKIKPEFVIFSSNSWKYIKSATDNFIEREKREYYGLTAKSNIVVSKFSTGTQPFEMIFVRHPSRAIDYPKHFEVLKNKIPNLIFFIND